MRSQGEIGGCDVVTLIHRYPITPYRSQNVLFFCKNGKRPHTNPQPPGIEPSSPFRKSASEGGVVVAFVRSTHFLLGGTSRGSYTGGRQRQVKERHKNAFKQRGADRKMRGAF
ncbi:unnamed protein product [Heligmosomoides polygyrus]|uniref:Uncharacterized protein n=1 Tax=Heligmosomoides polygyrus TaxID=6339 RepID=A0A183FR34_HELPZ|nr:unnamed protein product [Heligmosomoides polygyrus]